MEGPSDLEGIGAMLFLGSFRPFVRSWPRFLWGSDIPRCVIVVFIGRQIFELISYGETFTLIEKGAPSDETRSVSPECK